MRKFIFSTSALIAIMLVLPEGMASVLFPKDANALSGSLFHAGNIISDTKFYNDSAMSTSEVQKFLDKKVPDCDSNGEEMIYDSRYGDTVTRKKFSKRRGVDTPFICLKSYSKSTPNISANAQCSAYRDGDGTKSAARIIHEVGKACNVSQKVLLVLLQKEQSLVTDDWPWPIQYTKAMGYFCPDSNLSSSVDKNNNGCYDQYEGFFKQVYNAARQFIRYKQSPENYGHIPFRENDLRYHPNSGCGKKMGVYISSRATAGLYNYTPYTPNQAALNNLYGTGNNCSAYGNRNFWRMYFDWFGNPAAKKYEALNTYRSGGVTIEQGENSTVLTIRFQNVGSKKWYDKEGIKLYNREGKERPVFLDTNKPFHRPSELAFRWSKCKCRVTRYFSQTFNSDGTPKTEGRWQHKVEPGEYAEFTIRIKAKDGTKKGTYREFFKPVVYKGSGGVFPTPNKSFFDIKVE